MKPKPLTKEHILLAMRMTKSNKAAAKYLGVSYIHYKMWAKRYHEVEEGRSLFEAHKNQSGKGIPKRFVFLKDWCKHVVHKHQSNNHGPIELHL